MFMEDILSVKQAICVELLISALHHQRLFLLFQKNALYLSNISCVTFVECNILPTSYLNKNKSSKSSGEFPVSARH